MGAHLIRHLVLEDGGAVDHLHGDALPALRVLRELHLGERPLPDRPPHLVLPHPPQRPSAHHRRPSSLPPWAPSAASPGLTPRHPTGGGRRRPQLPYSTARVVLSSTSPLRWGIPSFSNGADFFFFGFYTSCCSLEHEAVVSCVCVCGVVSICYSLNRWISFLVGIFVGDECFFFSF